MKLSLLLRSHVAAVALLALACTSLQDPPLSTDPPPAHITVVAGENQIALIDQMVPVAPSVRVTDSLDMPVESVTVTFALTAGGGSVTGAVAKTDSTGVATLGSWKLGPTPGTNELTVVAADLPPVTLQAMAVTAPTGPPPPASIAIVAGQNQTALAGSTLPVPPSVRIADSLDAPVKNVSVTFAVSQGGGSITGATTQTDSNGIATVGSWTIGSTPGLNRLSVTVGTLPPIVIQANAVTTPPAPDSIEIVAGNNQSAAVGTAVAVSPRVRVFDNSLPLSGQTVTFTVTSGGGSVTGGSQVTDSAGFARVDSWVLGASTGVNQLGAVSGSVSTSFTATGTTARPPAAIQIVSGNNQSTRPGTAVAFAPRVRVVDSFGLPVSGAPVTFGVTQGGGSVTGGNQVTDPSGYAQVGSWVLGSATGSNKLTASAGSLSVVFSATARTPSITLHSMTLKSTATADSLYLSVIVSLVGTTSSVTGTVSGRTASFQYQNPGFGPAYWAGWINLAGLPAGNLGVSVTGTDNTGEQTTVSFPFVHDRVPAIGIVSPVNGDVATPSLDLNVTCVDDTDPCSFLAVTVVGGPVLASGTTAINTTVSLAAYVGQDVTLQFDAQAGDKTSRLLRVVSVINAPRLTRMSSAAGIVLDAVGNRVLHLDDQNVLRIQTSGTDTRIDSMTAPIERGWITPSGALFTLRVANKVSGIYEWRGAGVIGHGSTYAYTSGGTSALRFNELRISGGFAAWNTQSAPGGASRFVVRDLAGGTSTTIANVTWAAGIDVTSAGDAYFSASDLLDLYRYSSGNTTTVTSNTVFARGGPQTDGTISVYARWPAASPGVPTYSLAMFDGATESVLVPTTNGYDAIPADAYAVNSGWVAFLKPDGVAGNQLWTRAPNGTLQQVGSQYVMRIGALGEDGSLVYYAGSAPGGWHLAPAGGGTPVSLGFSVGSVVRRNGEYWFLLGRSVFRVVP